jgi:hypothetical protein
MTIIGIEIAPASFSSNLFLFNVEKIYICQTFKFETLRGI